MIGYEKYSKQDASRCLDDEQYIWCMMYGRNDVLVYCPYPVIVHLHLNTAPAADPYFSSEHSQSNCATNAQIADLLEQTIIRSDRSS